MENWLFIGGFASLDLVNTKRDRWSATPRETLTTPASITRWADAQGFGPHAFCAGDRELEEVRQFREALYALVMSPKGPARSVDIDLINQHACSLPGALLQKAPREQGVVVTRPAVGSVSNLLTVLAHEFIWMVGEYGTGKVKECEHERCGLVFVDASRGMKRRWCSMRRCGNRAKVQRHAQKGQPAQIQE